MPVRMPYLRKSVVTDDKAVYIHQLLKEKEQLKKLCGELIEEKFILIAKLEEVNK